MPAPAAGCTWTESRTRAHRAPRGFQPIRRATRSLQFSRACRTTMQVSLQDLARQPQPHSPLDPAPCRICAARRNTGSPPAISISSSTHSIPLISGSFHSSKYTRGRRLNLLADSPIASSPRRNSSVSASPFARLPTMRESMAIISKISRNAALVERQHRHPAPDQLARNLRLHIAKGKNKIRPQS